MASRDRSQVYSRRGFLLLAGAAGAILACIVVTRVLWGDTTPRYDSAAHAAALQRWKANAPKDYAIRIRVEGSQPAEYAVVVAQGEAIEASRNGHPLTQKRIFSTWTGDGMFGTLGADVHRLEAAQRNASSPPFDLRVEFDPTLGYPKRYRRIEFGSHVEVRWQVIAFEIRSPMS